MTHGWAFWTLWVCAFLLALFIVGVAFVVVIAVVSAIKAWLRSLDEAHERRSWLKTWYRDHETLQPGAACDCTRCEHARKLFGLMPAKKWRRLVLPKRYC